MANFERPALGCIEADFCKWILNTTHSSTRLKTLDDIHKNYTRVHLLNPIRKPWKTFLASVKRAKNTAPEKKQADRSNAARPRGSKEKKCTRYSAQTMRVRTAPIQKIKSCNAGQSARVVQRAICSASEIAPLRKRKQLKFAKHVRIYAVLLFHALIFY